MNQGQVIAFESLQAQLDSLYNEVLILVKKSPNDGINKFKLKLVNNLLTKTNIWLQEIKTSRPLDDFDVFNEDDIPSNSDVLIIVSQYLAWLERIRADNITSQFDEWYWQINGKQSNIMTRAPKKLST